MTDGFIGYTRHLAPEVISGSIQDAVTDIYAMGVTLYRLVAKRTSLIHGCKTRDQLLQNIRTKRFPPRSFPRHVPKKIIQIINKAMNPERNKRFQNCLEFRQALEKLHFGIDWKYHDEFSWTGQGEDGNYEANIILRRSNWDFNLFRNGRRIQKECGRFDDESLAREKMLSVVKSRTLR